MNDERHEHDDPTGEPNPGRLRKSKIILSSAALVLGIATIVVTVSNGGGPTSRGILFGAILSMMAGARLFLTVRHGL